MHHFDIIIIGNGIVGATTALLLARDASLKIAILDAKPSSQPSLPTINPTYDSRVSAISFASKKIFQHVGVWDAICAKRCNPYLKMYVWDEGGSGHIEFDAEKINESALGYIVEDGVMRESLAVAISSCDNIEVIAPVNLTSLMQVPEGVELISEDKKAFTAKLLIAADGANSWVRTQQQIELKSWDYGQTAIVATVKTERPHQQTAWQRFLSTGPLAFLPLDDPHYCSIVWSATHQDAEKLLSLTDEEFSAALSDAFENKLGSILSVSKRFHFPLTMRHAKQYVKENIVFIGDAAHTIHPLVGQGVNMGLLDAASLAEVILKAKKFNQYSSLRRYERWRKSDNLTMLAAVDGIKNLFISQNAILKLTRNAGLHFANHFSFLKCFFVRYALGQREDLPAICKSAIEEGFKQ